MQDRLDFFISELKKRGIYVNLNMNVARAFQDGTASKTPLISVSLSR